MAKRLERQSRLEAHTEKFAFEETSVADVEPSYDLEDLTGQQRWQMIEKLDLSLHELLYLLLLKLSLPGFKNISPRLTAKVSEKKKREMARSDLDAANQEYWKEIEEELEELEDDQRYIFQPLKTDFQNKLEILKKDLPRPLVPKDVQRLEVALCRLNKLFTQDEEQTGIITHGKKLVFPQKLLQLAKINHHTIPHFMDSFMKNWNVYLSTGKRELDLDALTKIVVEEIFPEIYMGALSSLAHIYGKNAMIELEKEAGQDPQWVIDHIE